MIWMLDDSIELEKVAAEAEWHRATMIERLIAEGLSREDADSYTAFVFADRAKVADAPPEFFVTDDQWDRLTLVSR